MKSKSKQIQLNKKQKKYIQKTKQYRNMKICVVKMKQQSKNKKLKSNQSPDIRSKIQNDLNQTKNEMKNLQKELSEVIQKLNNINKNTSNLKTALHQMKQTLSN